MFSLVLAHTRHDAVVAKYALEHWQLALFIKIGDSKTTSEILKCT